MMQNQEDSASNVDGSSNITVKVESLETPKKTEKKEDGEDPKPRIVLTFRSEKSGAKSSNMKIVTPEEKQEEVSPRRSSRTRHVSHLYEESEFVSRRDKSLSSQPASENDETSDNTHAPKRSTRGRSKECADSAVRKEPPPPTQRLSRRIKPTAKILANEELRIGLESQNNARLGIQSEKPEEGVSTRRSGQSKTETTTTAERRSSKRKFQDKEVKESELDESQRDSSVMKLKHLCELGLKAIQKSADEENDNSDDNENSESNVDVEDEEIDDDTEIINKLLEADEEWGGESSDDEYLVSEENSQGGRPRRSRRLCPGFGANDSDHSSLTHGEEKPKSRPRRSSRRTVNKVNYEDPIQCLEQEDDTESVESEFLPRRKKTRSTYDSGDLKLDIDEEENWDFAPKRKKNRTFEADDKSENDEGNSNPTAADEVSEAAEPADTSAVIATCFCEHPSNVYASPAELTEPVFCQAIEMVDGIRAGCSHPAMREGTAQGQQGQGSKGGLGDLAPLRRAGPRAPYFLACRLHTAQLKKHMCCPTCGLFCTQGIFYQCSKGHLFHMECGVLSSEAKLKPGCPHCGVTAYRWQAANRQCGRVQLAMHCSNERIYLPDQRVQCTPAYLSFSTTEKPVVDPGPVIPEDLLPSLPVDLKKLCKESLDDHEETVDANPVAQLYEAIVNGDPAELLIPKIVRGSQLNTPLEACDGGTCAHAAAARGRLTALVLLQYAGAALDALDTAGRTPLMRAILALLDKESPEEMEVEVNEEPPESTEDKKEESPTKEPQVKKEIDGDSTDDVIQPEVKQEVVVKEELAEEKEPEEKEKAGEEKPSDEDLMKVIKYLVAATDVNLPGPEGMTALHLAAQLGGASVCDVLLGGGADTDARDQGGWTPLVRACEHNRTDVIRILLREGADPCSADPEGNTALHWSALAGAAHALRLLLAAAPSAALLANKHGDTPLHIAAREGHYPCVVILLARGARPDAENSGGELPMQVATGQCHAAINLNLQMALAVKGKLPRWKLLDSDISRGREPFPVECVNEVDDEPLPQFTYVSRHVMPEPIAIDNSLQAIQGCACRSGGCGAGGCACGALGVRRWYRGARLLPAFPYHDPPMLFECTQTCACDLKRCSNHVVSRIEMSGSIGAPVTVFRTERCGWGLRAKRRIARGTPVALYCGELMPHSVADARDQDHYMFALHVKPDLLDQCSDKTQLCVDAARMGSCARFVNHSCAPNLAPVRVFTAARDLRLPVVALFAVRDVPPCEELTFDYGDKFWAVKSKWMKCECGSPNCRYPTKSTAENES